MPDVTTRHVTLTTPVRPYGEEVRKVTIRRPTTLELRQCGQPYVLVAGGGGGLKADYGVCAQLLTMVCDPPLPAATVDSLDPADFDDMVMILVGFTKHARLGASEAGPQPPG